MIGFLPFLLFFVLFLYFFAGRGGPWRAGPQTGRIFLFCYFFPVSSAEKERGVGEGDTKEEDNNDAWVFLLLFRENQSTMNAIASSSQLFFACMYNGPTSSWNVTTNRGTETRNAQQKRITQVVGDGREEEGGASFISSFIETVLLSWTWNAESHAILSFSIGDASGWWWWFAGLSTRSSNGRPCVRTHKHQIQSPDDVNWNQSTQGSNPSPYWYPNTVWKRENKRSPMDPSDWLTSVDDVNWNQSTSRVPNPIP